MIHLRRYTLYRYNRLHYAIDCETCKGKIANITPNISGGELLDRLEKHEEKYHKSQVTMESDG